MGIVSKYLSKLLLIPMTSNVSKKIKRWWMEKWIPKKYNPLDLSKKILTRQKKTESCAISDMWHVSIFEHIYIYILIHNILTQKSMKKLSYHQTQIDQHCTSYGPVLLVGSWQILKCIHNEFTHSHPKSICHFPTQTWKLPTTKNYIMTSDD